MRTHVAWLWGSHCRHHPEPLTAVEEGLFTWKSAVEEDGRGAWNQEAVDLMAEENKQARKFCITI